MTSGQAESCRRWGYGGRLAVIPNGVDCDRFRPVDASARQALRGQLGMPGDAFVLGYVGWMGHGKGSDVLFRVWQEAAGRCANVHLLCAGNFTAEIGTDEKLRAFLKRHGLPPSLADHSDIRRFGRVDNVETFLQASDVFVFPSRREGFGTVQIEAMACGLPCVVNDLPGVSSDIFPDERTGFRIPGNDVAGFVRVIERLARDAALRRSVGRAARRRAEACFGADRIADRYLGLYRDVLQNAA
jgi:glycosyltransferase involved in cell wall biosynthesis